jgi:prepilin-type N-terminal cleavage/methylation domain-containing protein
MHTLARFPAREARLNRQAGNRAFTLIELLTVIAIIAILAAITFGVVKGVNERAAIGQAKTELAVLSTALENYKKLYGDYPQTTDPAIFLQSLIGKKGPGGADMTQKNLLELSKFTLSTAAGDPFTTTSLTLLDPWGRNYLYYYYYTGATSATATRRGYILFSTGPDGTSTAPTPLSGTTGGDAKLSDSKNIDNIYSIQ